ELIDKLLPRTLAQKSCYLSGPSFAIELALELPTAVTLASRDRGSALRIQDALSSNFCRLYTSDDVIGVCVGGAFKNVIAIAAGACVALRLGRNALAALITRGLAEITRLAKCLASNLVSLSALSDAGDLILICTDDMSLKH